MGGRGSSSASSKISGGGGGGTLNFHNITQAEIDAIIDEQEETFTIDQTLAIKQYISAKATSNGYSMSQNLNYALDNGLPLNANEQYMDQQLSSAMHAIGTDINLSRAAHSDILTQLGAGNYQNMTGAQLSQALTGAAFKTKSYSSTSYDVSKNPFISGAQAGGREVIMNIKAAGTTRGIFCNKAQAEVVLDKGTTFKITGARFTGKTVYPRTSMTGMKQVELDIEIS